MIRRASADPLVRVVGLHAHVGSQITKIEPVRQVASAVSSFATSLQTDGVPLEHIDLGGGLGVAYTPNQTVLSESSRRRRPALRRSRPGSPWSSSRGAGSSGPPACC